MIKVIKDYKSIPSALTKKGCHRKVKRAVTTLDGNIYDGYYYKDLTVTAQLGSIYNHKCGYCESFSNHVATLQVEHFRPKAKVTEDSSHKGYYWLGCEWSNLLLACSKCNGKGAKGNFFPILGNRVLHDTPFNHLGEFNRITSLANSSFLANEQPLLLNPELDAPEQCLTFRYLGSLEGLNLKGRKSISTYKLNRNDLFLRRQDVVNKYVGQLKRILAKAKRGDYENNGYKNTLRELFEEIEYTNIKTQEYILWRWHIFNNFSDCILSRISAAYRRHVGKAFILYKQGKL
ncbi:MAG: Unknown protein [uncultured Aureispira sp.]|uniref:TIGR02646 family protein n=1 Tax=uncultured Aureispira sp. TaxID=1331704 RepID=A0A6S6S5N0_9BACT|nr:MAG: Unknown protein [uncultured Aureispira sp.]